MADLWQLTQHKVFDMQRSERWETAQEAVQIQVSSRTFEREHRHVIERGAQRRQFAAHRNEQVEFIAGCWLSFGGVARGDIASPNGLQGVDETLAQGLFLGTDAAVVGPVRGVQADGGVVALQSVHLDSAGGQVAGQAKNEAVDLIAVERGEQSPGLLRVTPGRGCFQVVVGALEVGFDALQRLVRKRVVGQVEMPRDVDGQVEQRGGQFADAVVGQHHERQVVAAQQAWRQFVDTGAGQVQILQLRHLFQVGGQAQGVVVQVQGQQARHPVDGGLALRGQADVATAQDQFVEAVHRGQARR